mgnify:CR=1 FL=1
MGTVGARMGRVTWVRDMGRQKEGIKIIIITKINKNEGGIGGWKTALREG